MAAVKYAIGFIAAALLAVGFVAAKPTHQPPKPCEWCNQDVATATYMAWNELDCDDADLNTATGAPPCNDELNDVNRGPKLHAVEVDKRGVVTVRLEVFLHGGSASEMFVSRFSRDGKYLGGD